MAKSRNSARNLRSWNSTIAWTVCWIASLKRQRKKRAGDRNFCSQCKSLFLRDRVQAVKDAEIPPGMVRMEEAERQKTLKLLNESA